MRSAVIWQVPKNLDGQILLEVEPLQLMDKFWQDDVTKPESGGIFLGYRRGSHLHVTMASAPQPSDARSRYSFWRSKSAHQDIALRKWRASKQTMDYLGEWHTHPEAHPMPSGKDYSEWAKICTSAQKPMLFLIIGWSGELWLGCSEGQRVRKCERLNQNLNW